MIVFVNGERREVEEAVTVAQVLGLGEQTPRGFAVALDGAVLPRAQHRTTPLQEGSRVEVVTAVQGG